MVNKTVADYADLGATPAAGDLIPIWDTSEGEYKYVEYDDLIGDGGTLTGGGVVATGGFTFTIPATGTAALLAGTQTFSALKTFSAGISLGNETLSIYDESTWTPVITATSSNPTVTYTTQEGKYTRIGNIVVFSLRIVLASISGGSGSLLFSLPLAVGGVSSQSTVFLSGVDFPASTTYVASNLIASTATATIVALFDNASNQAFTPANFSSGSDIRVSGTYLA